MRCVQPQLMLACAIELQLQGSVRAVLHSSHVLPPAASKKSIHPAQSLLFSLADWPVHFSASDPSRHTATKAATNSQLHHPAMVSSGKLRRTYAKGNRMIKRGGGYDEGQSVTTRHAMEDKEPTQCCSPCLEKRWEPHAQRTRPRQVWINNLARRLQKIKKRWVYAVLLLYSVLVDVFAATWYLLACE